MYYYNYTLLETLLFQPIINIIVIKQQRVFPVSLNTCINYSVHFGTTHK